MWGTEPHLRKLFASGAAAIGIAPRVFSFCYRCAEHFTEIFRTRYRPVHKACAVLPAEQADGLMHDLAELLNGLNRAASWFLIVPSDYLEVVMTRR
jgi:hypothetical protein